MSLDLSKTRTETPKLGRGPIGKAMRQMMDEVTDIPLPKPSNGYITNDPQEELRKAFQAHRSAQSIRQRTAVTFTKQAMSTQAPLPLTFATTQAVQNHYRHVGDVGKQGVPLTTVAGPEFQDWVAQQFYKTTAYQVAPSELIIHWEKAQRGKDMYVVQHHDPSVSMMSLTGAEARDACTKIEMENIAREKAMIEKKLRDEEYARKKPNRLSDALRDISPW